MDLQTERNLGEQPLAALMQTLELNAHAIVEASTEQITHKMISRAVKGRRLTQNVKLKVRNAVNRCTGNTYALSDLFNY